LDLARPRVAAVVSALLNRHAGHGQLDVIGDFTSWLPIDVMIELFGLSRAHRAQYRAWSTTMARILEPAINLPAIRQVAAAIADCHQHLSAVVAQRRRQPGDDFISAMLQLDVGAQPVTDEEAVAYISILLGAGYETTANLIANGIVALVRNPDQLRILRRDPGLVDMALEELIRFDSPVQLHSRWATDDVHFGERTVRKGDRVILLIGSGNRDPARFPLADHVQLARGDDGSLSFGRGTHYCIGAPLARLQASTALQLLLATFPNIGPLLEGPVWRTQYLALRGPSRLTIATGP
jgi:cytochrome P450